MDQHDNKESSLVVDTPQPPELPTQQQRRRPSLFFLQMNETDGIIVVEVGLCGHFRAMDDDESGNIHHHYFLSQHGSFDRSCLETSSSSSRCRAPQCQIRRNLLARLQHCRTRVLYLHFVPRTDLFIIQKDLFIITNNAVALSSSAKRYSFLGACHEIYVRLIFLHHRTQDRHTFSVSIKNTPRSPRKKAKLPRVAVLLLQKYPLSTY